MGAVVGIALGGLVLLTVLSDPAAVRRGERPFWARRGGHGNGGGGDAGGVELAERTRASSGVDFSDAAIAGTTKLNVAQPEWNPANGRGHRALSTQSSRTEISAI